MAALDAAERELDAAFARFEVLVERLQGWRKVETDAARRVAAAEAHAVHRVTAALAEAERAREERAAALAERSSLAEQLAARERAAAIETERLAGELAGAQNRLERVVAESRERTGDADRRIRALEQALNDLREELRSTKAERQRLATQVPQLAAGRAALERENLMLKGEAERQTGELAAVRARADRLETSARETVAHLQQLLAPGA